MKGALHLLFEIIVVFVLNKNSFFGITMLYVFFFCILKYNFKLLLQVQVHLLCMIVWLHFMLCLLALASYIVPSDGFTSA